jgi:hypothetical protein
MKASPAQAVIAEHEAGMHERRAKDTCKACQKEIQEMAKQKTTCEICGGSYDGTPSGLAKHNGTIKHINAGRSGAYAATQEARKAPKITDAASLNAAFPPVEKPAKLTVVKHDDSGLPVEAQFVRVVANGDLPVEMRLDALIVEKSRERDRRVGDHKWRVEHQPAKADAYFADKVQPLLDEIALLKEAIVALKMLQQK